MLIVTAISVLTLILTYLESRRYLKDGMKLGFILISILGIIHYDYGNDYMSYYDMYNSIVHTPFNWTNILNGSIYKEPGWVLINYFFEPLGGFFMMVAVLNVIQNVIYYKFIKANVERTWRPIAVFIYLFSTSFYLLNFSMMRQGLVIAIFLWMWKYIKNRKWFIALLGLIAGSFIHTSAIILIPFAFWGFIPMKNGRFLAILYVSLFIALWIGESFLNNIFETLLIFEDFEDYTDIYNKDSESVHFGVGFIINMIPFVVSIYYLLKDKTQTEDKHQLVALAAVGFMILPFGKIIPLVARVGMYFSALSIGAFTSTYSVINNRMFRYSLIGIYILITLYDYWNFFHNSIYAASYQNFKTIFTV